MTAQRIPLLIVTNQTDGPLFVRVGKEGARQMIPALSIIKIVGWQPCLYVQIVHVADATETELVDHWHIESGQFTIYLQNNRKPAIRFFPETSNYTYFHEKIGGYIFYCKSCPGDFRPKRIARIWQFSSSRSTTTLRRPSSARAATHLNGGAAMRSSDRRSQKNRRQRQPMPLRGNARNN